MALFFEDGDNVTTNSVTVSTQSLGSGTPKGPLYNAVLQIKFGDVGSEPVSLDEAREWCRIDVSDNDATLALLIIAGRQACETYANIGLIQRTVAATIQTPNGYMRLPYGPVNDITGVADLDGNAIAEGSGYTVNALGIKANATRYTVTYASGYSSSDTEGLQTIPGDLKIAILNQILYMYDNRGDAQKISPAAMVTLNAYRYK